MGVIIMLKQIVNSQESKKEVKRTALNSQESKKEC